MSSSSPHMASAPDSQHSSRRPHTIEQGENTLITIEQEMKHFADLQEHAIPRLCKCLEVTVAYYDHRPLLNKPPLNNFEGDPLPISVSYYVRRILMKSRCSTCSIILALIYLERLKKRQPNLKFRSTSIQRLLLVATMTAAKFCDDFLHSNARWARIGGLSLQELNFLEVEFLFNIEFDLNITPEKYADFVRKNLGISFPEQGDVKFAPEVAPEKPTAGISMEDTAAPSKEDKAAPSKEDTSVTKQDFAWIDDATTEKPLKSQGSMRGRLLSAPELSMDNVGDAKIVVSTRAFSWIMWDLALDQNDHGSSCPDPSQRSAGSLSRRSSTSTLLSSSRRWSIQSSRTGRSSIKSSSSQRSSGTDTSQSQSRIGRSQSVSRIGRWLKKARPWSDVELDGSTGCSGTGSKVMCFSPAKSTDTVSSVLRRACSFLTGSQNSLAGRRKSLNAASVII